MTHKKQYSIDQLASASARRSQSEAAMMQGEIKKLRASLANVGRQARLPTIQASRKMTKKTTTDASIWGSIEGFALAELARNGLLGDNARATGTTAIGSSTFSYTGETKTPIYDEAYSTNKYASSGQRATLTIKTVINGQRIR